MDDFVVGEIIRCKYSGVVAIVAIPEKDDLLLVTRDLHAENIEEVEDVFVINRNVEQAKVF